MPYLLRALCLLAAAPLMMCAASPLQDARDKQDRDSLQQQISTLQQRTAQNANDAEAHYQLALANSYAAEVALQVGDKKASRAASETGVQAAQKAVQLKPSSAEYHRILGTLCGQVIPANLLAGLKYGRCAMDEITKAIELDPRSARAYLSRGVGNYYLPPQFGGGIELAIKDFQKALELDSKLDDAYLWLGIALREANRNGEARKALQRAVALNPQRIWATQQLQKTAER